jgi:hypothetical protein
LAGLSNAVFGLVVELGLEDEPDGVSDRKHSAHTRGDGFGQIERFEVRTVANHDGAVALGKGSILDGLNCGGVRLGDLTPGRRFFRTGVNAGWE